DAVIGARRIEGAYLVAARAERLSYAGQTWRLRHPIVVFGDSRAWAVVLPGARLRVSGRLGPARERGGAAVLTARAPPLMLARPPLIQRAAGTLRAGLLRAAAPLPRAERGLLPGLVDGDTARLPPELREDFRRTGLTHLVAVSGTNCAIVLGVVLLLARRYGLGLRAATMLGAVALSGFVVLARPSPSVLRAALMGALALFATMSGRLRTAFASLAAAVVGLLLFDPALAREPGFALSVLATAGLVVLAPSWRARLSRHLPGWLADAVSLPLAAQVACAPVIAAISGQVSLVAVPANLLAMPAVGAATIGGVAAACIAPICLPLARVVARFAGIPTHWLVIVATRFARAPAASLGWPHGLRGAVLLTVVTIAAATAVRYAVPRRVLGAVGCAVLVAGLGVRVVSPGWPVPGWVLVACDVGQGDALVVSTATAAIVVDTGPDPVAIDRCLHDLGVRRIAAVILTHLHADHVEGLPGVLRGRRVAVVQTGPLDEPADELARVQRWTTAAHVPLDRLSAGDARQVDDVRYDVLAPRHVLRGTDSDPNNASLVLRLLAPHVTLLLTGDIEQPAQQAVLDAHSELGADVVKVPHHGSAKQLDGFLAKTRASVAITSVGRDNPYGHPAASTMRVVREDGMRGYRTDEDGDIAVVRVDGRLVVVGRRGRGTPPDRPPPLAWTLASARTGWCPVRPRDEADANVRVG
ncbi:MAG: DNA internalization-related competence protein ComEC/Rec2, partial [Frankia sp.]|nr:DNA internalization-related competence protein ComEC/Rec2 [Frankia sp.]